jgi:UPF0755 protein
LVSYEHRESLDSPDVDALIFGAEDESDAGGQPGSVGAPSGGSRRSGPTRRQRQHKRRQRRRRRLLSLFALLAVVIVAVSGWLIVRPLVSHSLQAKDYAGPGTGSVLIQVNNGDDATDIAATLKSKDVVRTETAFVAAAKANPSSMSIQPGAYQMRTKMAANQALTYLINPNNRVVVKVTVPEGATMMNVETLLASSLHVPVASVKSAAAAVAASDLPDGYRGRGGVFPTSLEGFLYPDTYQLNLGIKPAQALQQMVAEYTSKDRTMNFAGMATKLHNTPYQLLIIASMVQAEAKYPSDMPKVARVIFNRLRTGMDLGIDSTSVYGAELAGTSTKNIDFDTPALYNTRHTTQLPPTPIGNPGEDALQATLNPAPGAWKWYVNGDAQGHLAFATTDAQFGQLAQACVDHHWGCT